MKTSLAQVPFNDESNQKKNYSKTFFQLYFFFQKPGASSPTWKDDEARAMFERRSTLKKETESPISKDAEDRAEVNAQLKGKCLLPSMSKKVIKRHMTKHPNGIKIECPYVYAT